MGYSLLHHNGAYNLYNSVSDGPAFDPAFPRSQLEAAIRHVGQDPDEWITDDILDQVHARGTSSYFDPTLEDFLVCNRAGPDEETLTCEEFVARYLTLPPGDAE